MVQCQVSLFICHVSCLMCHVLISKNIRDGKVLALSSPCRFIIVQDNRVDPFVFTNTLVLLLYDEFHKYIDAI